MLDRAVNTKIIRDVYVRSKGTLTIKILVRFLHYG